MNKHTSKIRKLLKENIDTKAKISFQRFFKEKIKFYGVRSAKVAKITEAVWEDIKNLRKAEIFETCEELYKSDYEEEAWVASGLCYKLRNKFSLSDFKTFERWIDKYINDWAKCDGFCNHTIGYFIEKHPEYIKELKKWAKSDNRWVKRASAVSLIIPAKEGKFLKDAFEISDILLNDEDDMVQKGYGWLLKEESRKHVKEVLDYVIKHKDSMPRTSLRYAIEKMPEPMRKAAMRR